MCWCSVVYTDDVYTDNCITPGVAWHSDPGRLESSRTVNRLLSPLSCHTLATTAHAGCICSAALIGDRHMNISA
jgi:hypothetical protein